MTPDDVHPDGPDRPDQPNRPHRAVGVDDAALDTELHGRFDAFRTLPTPPPVPVADLPAARRSSVRSLPAAAAVVVVLSLLTLAVLTTTRDHDADVATTASSVAPATSSVTPTTRAMGTGPTTVPAPVDDTTTTGPTTATTVPPTTVQPGAPTTVSRGDGGGGDGGGSEPPPTEPPTVPPTEPPTTAAVRIPPPASVPAGAPVPPGQESMYWKPNEPVTADAASFAVSVGYVRCPSWPILWGVLPPVITETADAVVITFAAEPTSPMTSMQGCKDTVSMYGRWTVTLAQPLGDRWLYDGSADRNPTPTLIADPNDR